jgi:hypothetical protein
MEAFTENDRAAVRKLAQSLIEDCGPDAPIVPGPDLGSWTRTVTHSTAPENFGQMIADTGWQKIERHRQA